MSADSREFARRVQVVAGTQFSLDSVRAILAAADQLRSGWPDAPIPTPQDRREDLPSLAEAEADER